MTQSSTLYVGMDVHKDSIAVAYVAKDSRRRGHLPRHHRHPTVSTSINSSASCNPKPNTWSLSMKPAPVGIGSIAI